MADFNVDLSAPQASGARPIAPVHENVTQFTNPFISLAAGAASIFIKNKEETEKKEREARDQAVIGNFTREQTSINDMIRQGGSMARASAQSRANFSKYAANFPHLVDSFNKTQTSLFANTELGRAKSEEELYMDARKTEIKDMIKNGIPVSENAPTEVIEANLEAFRASRRAEVDFDRIVKLKDFQNRQSAAERTETDWIIKQESVKLLSAVGDTHLKTSFQNVQEIVGEARKSGNIELGQMKLLQYFSNIESSLVGASSLNPELARPYKDLFTQVKQLGMDSLEGKNAEVYEKQLKELQSKIMLTALASPENKAYYATSKLFGGQIPTLFLEANSGAKNTIVKLTSEFGAGAPLVVGNKDVEKTTYKTLMEQVKSVEGNLLLKPEAVKEAVSIGTNNILRQLGSSVTNGISNKDLGETMEFLASPEYAKIVSYGKIDRQSAEAAHKVFSLSYERDVSKAIEGKLSEGFTSRKDGRKIPYGDLVDFKWDGGGVVVNSRDYGYSFDLMEREGQAQFQRDMTNSVKAVNQLIKVGAHMEGHTNYMKYWEENKHNMLPTVFPDPAKLQVGKVVNGFKYIGGNVSSPNSWVKEVETK